jgi:hypothetical protein
MMVDGAEERQLKGPIDVLAPYSLDRHSVLSPVSARPLVLVRARL